MVEFQDETRLIGAAIILYKPDSDMSYVLISTILAQVDKLVIVDNSPVRSELQLNNDKIHYCHFSQNIGVAAAHNVALKHLMQQKCDFALLLDQDSQISDDFVFRLSSLLVASKIKNQPIVAIGPRVICSFSDKIVKPRVQRTVMTYGELVCVTQIISSGMFIDLSKLDDVGLKDETLFIDGVDHEWCWRARQKGYMVAIADQLQMVHRLGDARSKFVGVTYKVGSPVRLYYQFRNILLLSRRDYVPIYWKLRNLVYMPLRFVLNSCLQPNKKERFYYMLHGLWDGLKCKTGPYPKQ